jgi:hypothetical protein
MVMLLNYIIAFQLVAAVVVVRLLRFGTPCESHHISQRVLEHSSRIRGNAIRSSKNYLVFQQNPRECDRIFKELFSIPAESTGMQ